MERLFAPGEAPLEFTVSEGGRRLDAALADALPGGGLRMRRRLWQWCRVLVNGKERGPAWRVKAGDRVCLEEMPGAEKVRPGPFGPGARGETEGGLLCPHAGVPAREEAGPRGRAGTAGDLPDLYAGDPAGLVRLVAANRDFAALYKPAGMHTARLAGGGEPGLEGLLTALWPRLWAEHAGRVQGEVSGLGGSSGAFAGGGHDERPVSIPSPPRLLTRLDWGTSGLALAAFSPEAARRFREWEAGGAVEKWYFAVVRGDLRQALDLGRDLDTADRKKTRVRTRENADSARRTRVVPLRPVRAGAFAGGVAAAFPAGGAALPGIFVPAPALAGPSFLMPDPSGPSVLTLALAGIRRGARHQIRAHLAAAGFPLYGDAQYGGVEQKEEAARSYFLLHHGAVRLPGFSAVAMPGWGLGEKAEDLPFSGISVR